MRGIALVMGKVVKELDVAEALEIKEVVRPGAELLDEIGRFRVQVWEEEGMDRAGFAKGEASWTDALDHEATHSLVRGAHGLVAAARVTLHASHAALPDELWPDIFDEYRIREDGRPIGWLSRAVVARDYRRQGLGRRLHVARVRAAWRAGVARVMVSASPAAVGLLASLGFVALAARPGRNFPSLNWSLMALEAPLSRGDAQ